MEEDDDATYYMVTDKAIRSKGGPAKPGRLTSQELADYLRKIASEFGGDKEELDGVIARISVGTLRESDRFFLRLWFIRVEDDIEEN